MNTKNLKTNPVVSSLIPGLNELVSVVEIDEKLVWEIGIKNLGVSENALKFHAAAGVVTVGNDVGIVDRDGGRIDGAVLGSSAFIVVSREGNWSSCVLPPFTVVLNIYEKFYFNKTLLTLSKSKSAMSGGL